MTTPYLNRLKGDGEISIPGRDEDGELQTETLCAWTIDDITLDTEPDWIDKDKFVAQVGSLHECIDGSDVMQVFERDLTGTPITLTWDGKKGALLAATVDSLKALADAGDSFDFDDGSGAIECIFDYPKENPVDFDWFDDNRVVKIGTVYLIRV
jgi:hypothetical protein